MGVDVPEALGFEIFQYILHSNLRDAVSLSRTCEFFHAAFVRARTEQGAYLNYSKTLTGYQLDFTRRIANHEAALVDGTINFEARGAIEPLRDAKQPRFAFGYMIAPPGSGKTLVWIRYLIQHAVLRPLDRTLIIVPPVLLRQWLQEFRDSASEAISAHDISVESFHNEGTMWIQKGGVDLRRLSRSRIVITSSATSHRAIAELNKGHWTRVVVDEITGSSVNNFAPITWNMQQATSGDDSRRRGCMWFINADNDFATPATARYFHARLGCPRNGEHAWSTDGEAQKLAVKANILSLQDPNAQVENFDIAPPAVRYVHIGECPDRWSTYNRRELVYACWTYSWISSNIKTPFRDESKTYKMMSELCLDTRCADDDQPNELRGAAKIIVDVIDSTVRPGEGALLFLPDAERPRDTGGPLARYLEARGFECQVGTRSSDVLQSWLTTASAPGGVDKCRRLLILTAGWHSRGLNLQKFACHVFSFKPHDDKLLRQQIGRIVRPGQARAMTATAFCSPSKLKMDSTGTPATWGYWPARVCNEYIDEFKEYLTRRATLDSRYFKVALNPTTGRFNFVLHAGLYAPAHCSTIRQMIIEELRKGNHSAMAKCQDGSGWVPTGIIARRFLTECVFTQPDWFLGLSEPPQYFVVVPPN